MPVPASSTLGIYVSIPFCRAKCSYCNFASGVFGAERMESYIQRLTEEIRSAPQQAQRLSAILPTSVDSIYFGGGTPSLLSPEQMQQVMLALREVFSIHRDAEITLECAPGQLSEPLLAELPGLGFNRVSLGVQSFVNHEAAAVGRLHTRDLTLKEIDRLRAAGISDINIDLIAGLPHQTPESWQTSLDQAIATGVPHLSVYMLDVDEDSRLGREMLASGNRYGATHVPGDESIAAMYTQACEQFATAGIPQYEISNFARPGHRSRHNLKYWTQQPWLGFGLDAHSFLATQHGPSLRIAPTDDLASYLNNAIPATVTPISATESIEEAWFLGLRLNAGISLGDMQRKIGSAALRAFDPVLAECIQQGLLAHQDDRVHLTQQGRLFANEVFTRFLGVLPASSAKVQIEEGVPA